MSEFFKGKPISDMDVTELLLAISETANRLYTGTGEERYKRTSDFADGLLVAERYGMNEDEAIRAAMIHTVASNPEWGKSNE